jgi:amidase
LLDALRGTGITHRATGHATAPATFSEALQGVSRRLRIGITTRHPWESFSGVDLHEDADLAYRAVASHLEGLGHDVVELNWEPRSGYPEAFTTIWKSAAASLDLAQSEHELLEPLTRYLVEAGEHLGAHELARALRELSAWEEDTIGQFSSVDVVLTPGLATVPPRLGFYDAQDPEVNFRQQVEVTPYSSFVNVAGLPALALPVALGAEGLPVGIQLVGQPGGDATLLQLGAELEQVLGFTKLPAPTW